MTERITFADRARPLLEQGYPVFPCRPDKRPYTVHGFKDASTDTKQILEWSTEWPDALVGVPTGKITGLFVLDVDAKNGKDGFATLQAKGWHLPVTRTHWTKSGSGVHYLFRLPNGVALKSSSGHLGAGLDTRGDGGYIIWWPAHGGRVEHPDTITEVPRWLVEALAQTSANPARGACAAAETITAGERNNSLFRLGAALRAKGLSVEAIEAALQAENATKCRPPLSADEVRSIAKSAGRYAPGIAAPPPPTAEHPYQYQANLSGTMRKKMSRDGCVWVEVSNFTARIVDEEVRDDGAERRVVFRIAGQLKGEDLPVIKVGAERFAALTWVTECWGGRAVVYAGQGNKDHMRAAIQLLSGDVPRRTVYEHLGWRKIDGKWVYLHAGGAIGDAGAVDGISVEMDEALRHFVLPEPPRGEALSEAVRASLSLLDVAPERLIVPLLAAIYRAPLAELLPADFSIFYVGPTGAKKTSLTALAQAHYGRAFADRHLPCGWEATGNALERLAFLAKDALLVIDDFCPKGTTADVQRLNREADRVLRAQANCTGRRRMNADGSLRPTYTPRGVLISSGEDVPMGQSLRARLLILEVGHEDVDLTALSRSQEHAAKGLLASSMAAYVSWLAGRLDALGKELPQRKRALRDKARQYGWPHDRTPDMLANLALGWEELLRFAQETGALTAEEREFYWRNGWEVMAEAAREQADHQASEEPTARFLALLNAAIASGRAHVAHASTGAAPENAEKWGWRRRNTQDEWQAQGERVGWLDGEQLLLEPEAAFAAVQRLAREQGTCLPITQRTLWARMREKGLIASHEKGRYTTHWAIHSHPQKRPRVIHIHAATLSPKTGATGTSGTRY